MFNDPMWHRLKHNFGQDSKNRTIGEMIKAFKKLMEQLKAANTFSQQTHLGHWGFRWLCQTHQNGGNSIKKVASHMHHCNIAEKAIKAFKNHFISLLASIDKILKIHLCDQLLLQTEMTWNMPWATNILPYISAHLYIHGQHDCNGMPLAPWWCHAMAHNNPETRTSWGPRASEGFYVGTSTEHYLCFKISMKETQSIQESQYSFNTDTFKHPLQCQKAQLLP